jgi:hypothetical protein
VTGAGCFVSESTGGEFKLVERARCPTFHQKFNAAEEVVRLQIQMVQGIQLRHTFLFGLVIYETGSQN